MKPRCDEIPWPEVDAWRKEPPHDFERALTETKLPERPDYEAANCFLINARREMTEMRGRAAGWIGTAVKRNATHGTPPGEQPGLEPDEPRRTDDSMETQR